MMSKGFFFSFKEHSYNSKTEKDVDVEKTFLSLTYVHYNLYVLNIKDKTNVSANT